MGNRGVIQLTAEESIILLTARPYLRPEDDEVLVRLLHGPVQWDFVLWRVEYLRTLPMLRYHIRRLGASPVLPRAVSTYLDLWSELSAKRSELLFRELERVSRAFDRHNVAHYVFKGGALGPLLYPDPWLRPMLDLDFMIRPEAVGVARTVMRQLGYVHGIWDPDTDRVTEYPPERILEYQSPHYELPAFLKRVTAPVGLSPALVPRTWRVKHLKLFIHGNGICSFPVFVDLHVNLSLDFDQSDVWAGVETEEICGNPMRVQSMTDAVWFLAARLYHEAFQFNTPKLTMLSDIHTILVCRKETLNWPRLLEVVTKYGMQPALFYVLTQLRGVAGAEVPEKVLEATRPDRMPMPNSHDWGDIMLKIFPRSIVHEIKYA